MPINSPPEGITDWRNLRKNQKADLTAAEEKYEVQNLMKTMVSLTAGNQEKVVKCDNDNRHKVAKLIQLAKMVKWAETAHVLINSCENGVCIVNFLRNISEIW